MSAQNLAEFLRDNLSDISNQIAARIRMDNPSYADRALQGLKDNATMWVDSISQFLTNLEWDPVANFVKAITSARFQEFRVSDVLGAFTTAERALVQYIEDHDSDEHLRTSAQYVRLEAGLHRLRTAFVESFWGAACRESVERLTHAQETLASFCAAHADLATDLKEALEDLTQTRDFLERSANPR